MDKYRVIDYFDVWGNKNDGWEVNNLAKVGEIEVDDFTNYTEIIRKLKEIGYLSEKARKNSFEIWNDYSFIEFYIKKENNKPMFRLELIQE